MKAIARGWAGLDLLVTGAMALPPVAGALIALIYRLSGEEAPPDDPMRAFFVCLAGALGVLWAWVRLADPRRALVLADTVGRLWVAALIGGFVFGAGAPVALLLFVATELAGAAHQAHALWRDGGV